MAAPRAPAFPVLRFCLRCAPPALRPAIWRHVVERLLFLRPYDFCVATVFRSRLHGNTEDFIQALVYFFGVWEPNLTRWIQRRLRRGDVFVDVGANIGYYSLLASRLVGPTGSVVAIEPSASIIASLQRNLDANGVTNVRVVPMAVSDAARTLRLFRGPDDNRGQTTTRHVAGDARFTFEAEVRAAPLAAILTEAEIRRARLIKIDVEGAEFAVVSGLLPLLGHARPDLEVIVEIVPEFLGSQGRAPTDIVELFEARGYCAYTLGSEYDGSRYADSRSHEVPRRLRAPITSECNVLFSRTDAELLP
jgi:FkbM family methyltransferase